MSDDDYLQKLIKRSTTSSFTKEAEAFAVNNEFKVILIDGQTLTELMIDYGVGVTRQAVYELKRIDSDYFTEA